MSRADRTDRKHAVRESVRKGYATIAKDVGSCCASSRSCCGAKDAAGVAKAIGYSNAELAALPDGANMGLSCGNPGAIAALKPGEVVLDLGSGGGFDCFIAAARVGRRGRVIGVDMTPEMLGKARRNTETFRKQSGLANVEFRLGEIEHLPIANNSVDVVISNCVINLSPDKQQVWREMARVLKPGGRVAVSDLALLRPLPPAVLKSVEALVGCIAGAVLVSETQKMARAAGFRNIATTRKPGYIESMSGWQDPLYRKLAARLPRGTKPSDFVTSLDVSARKP